jgi:hypothetical protein
MEGRQKSYTPVSNVESVPNEHVRKAIIEAPAIHSGIVKNMFGSIHSCQAVVWIHSSRQLDGSARMTTARSRLLLCHSFCLVGM